MKFEVYCDESHPDVLASQGNHAQYLLIGSLWLPADLRAKIKEQIKRLRQTHHFNHEIKWHKVHADRESFYQDLIHLYLEHGELLRFRCIAVDSAKVNLVRFHENDQELGFYKFYYQMLHHWLLSFNEYTIFCDEKTNRRTDRIKTLKQVLNNANLSSRITSVQALPSKEVGLLQLTDFLLGMASSRLNNTVGANSCKDRLICYLEQRLDVRPLGPTCKSEQKYNIFKINLDGGW